MNIKPGLATILYTICTIHKSTIPASQTQTQHNSTTVVVQYCTIGGIWGLKTQHVNTILWKKSSENVVQNDATRRFWADSWTKSFGISIFSIIVLQNKVIKSQNESKLPKIIKILENLWLQIEKQGIKLIFKWESDQNTTDKHNSDFSIVQYCTIHFPEISNTTQQHNFFSMFVLCCVVAKTGLKRLAQKLRKIVV